VLGTLLIASGDVEGGKRRKNIYKKNDLFSSPLTLSLSTGIYTVKRLIFNKDKKRIMGFRSSGFYFKTLPIYTRFSRLKNIRIRMSY